MVTFVLENSYTTTQSIDKTYYCSLEKLENAVILASENNQIKNIEDKFGTLDFSGAGDELGFNSYEIEPSMLSTVFEELTKTIEQYL